MSFVKVASAKDLGSGKMVGVKAGDEGILVVNLEGRYYAIGNRCTHAGCTLSGGELRGGVVECPRHDSQFDVKTGRVVGGPAQKPEPLFKLKVEGDQISVSI